MAIISAENEPVTTNREEIIAQYLEKIGICFKRNTVYCFTCKDYFIHQSRLPPNKCFIGNHPFNGAGQFCVPDILLFSPLYKSVSETYNDDEKQKPEVYSDQCRERPANKQYRHRPIGAIMINEKRHYKNQYERNKVANQVKEFQMGGMKVFVLREADIDRATDFSLISMSYYISQATNNTSVHELYSRGFEFKDRTASYRELAGR